MVASSSLARFIEIKYTMLMVDKKEEILLREKAAQATDADVEDIVAQANC